jgi:predicted RecA/RadA family phage recombinase
MKNAVSSGNVIPYTPTVAVASGTTVLIGTKLGVAIADIAANATGSAQVTGVFSVAKLSTDAVAQGAALYWDNTNKRLTTTASGNTYGGFAERAAGAGVAAVNIKLNG